MKYSNYDVIRSSKIEEVISLVNAKMLEGWTVLEGVLIQVQPAPGGGGFITYVQTVVK